MYRVLVFTASGTMIEPAAEFKTLEEAMAYSADWRVFGIDYVNEKGEAFLVK